LFIGKFKLGELYLYCQTKDKNGFGVWFHISCFGDFKDKGLQAAPAVNSDQQPTGRIYMNLTESPAEEAKPTSIRISGSRLRFARQLCAKPNLDEHPKHVRVKKVRFDFTREEM
jgi:hypothetical protein